MNVQVGCGAKALDEGDGAAASIRRAVPDDADDDHVLTCALATQADLIVSGDAHLRNLKRYHGMRIVAAAEALAIIAEA